MSAGLLTAIACTGESGPTPTVTPSPTATPMVTKEWDLEEIQVYGSTVSVSLYMYAGVDVQVTLDGRTADEVRASIPTVEYLFNDVAPGTYTIEVEDVVGFSETSVVVMSTAPPLMPWQADLVRKLEKAPVANPPASLVQYGYKGRVVYYVPPRCCDIFSDLYDANGKVIGHPDGGITGQGDGRVTDFLKERENDRIAWKDQRNYDTSLVQAQAPIESIDVLVMESFPPQYSVVVVSGLPNACVTFAGYRMDRDGDTVQIEVINWKPSRSDVVCAEIYGTVMTTITLGSDFIPGHTYTVAVNGVTETFVAQ